MAWLLFPTDCLFFCRFLLIMVLWQSIIEAEAIYMYIHKSILDASFVVTILYLKGCTLRRAYRGVVIG